MLEGLPSSCTFETQEESHTKQPKHQSINQFQSINGGGTIIQLYFRDSRGTPYWSLNIHTYIHNKYIHQSITQSIN